VPISPFVSTGSKQMKGVQCGQCGLSNFRSQIFCKRCGFRIGEYMLSSSKSKGAVHAVPKGPRQAAKQSSWIYTMLFIAVIGGAAYYLYSGFLSSFDEVNQKDPSQTNGLTPRPQPTLTSRSDSDQKRLQPFKNAIHNSQGLAESEKRLAETRKLMQPAR